MNLLMKGVEKMRIINLEQGMPTTDRALVLMGQMLRTAKAGGERCIKLIHGYGSTGSGGAIRAAVCRELRARQATGSIRLFVQGDRFSPFYEEARRAVDLCTELAKDRDYARANQGITIVVL